MPSISQLAIRGLQLAFVVILTGLVGNAIAIQAFHNTSVNYAIFVCVFAWIVIIYGFIAAFVESVAVPIALMVLDGLALLFTLIAGIVLAAKLGVHSCGNRGYLLTNSLTQNSRRRCHELQAATAFFWFLFAAFIASLVIDFMSGRNGMSRRRKGPNMAQVV